MTNPQKNRAGEGNLHLENGIMNLLPPNPVKLLLVPG